MGAVVDVSKLKKLEERLDVDLTAEVETRFGNKTLVEVFASAGRRAEVEYVVDAVSFVAVGFTCEQFGTYFRAPSYDSMKTP